MRISRFIGRVNELAQLTQLYSKASASLVVVQGRRRIGKSRLIDEFAQGCPVYKFVGLSPEEKLTAQNQREEFARQLARQTNGVELSSGDWGNLFTGLAQFVQEGRNIIVFDEISWMGDKDVTFLPKLKTAWDEFFSKNPKLILILSGSVSAWIQKNIIASTGFLGRPTLIMCLEELSLDEAELFWGAKASRISAYEKLKILSVTGGIPRYLELIDPCEDAESNIRRLFFQKNSILKGEFNLIFNDIFGKKAETYKKLVQVISAQSKNISDIISELGYVRSGKYSEYVNDLVLAGFLEREYTFNLASQRVVKSYRYRIKDNYLRFYLKYLDKHLHKIDSGQMSEINISALPGWQSLLGFQFENLVLNNGNRLIKLLGIMQEDLIFAGPHYQSATERKQACQIDFFVVTRHRTLYVCEVKFSKNVIPMSIISEMEEKISKLVLPKNYSVRSVLIHVNGVSDQVEDLGYFSKIIDFSDFFMQTQS